MHNAGNRGGKEQTKVDEANKAYALSGNKNNKIQKEEKKSHPFIPSRYSLCPFAVHAV